MSDEIEYSADQRYPQWRLWLPAILVMACVTGGSAFAVVPPEGPSIPYFDKISHFCVFGLIATLLFRASRRPLKSHRRWLIAYGWVLCFGVLDEVLQGFNPVRSFDPFDWLADGTGPLLALALYRNWCFYRRLLEFRLWAWLAKGRGRASNPAQ